MQILDCAKTIGLTMTDSYMMSPTKSVTAVIGAGTSDTDAIQKAVKPVRNKTVYIEGIQHDKRRLERKTIIF